ncbi:MAG: ABC transporter ATP-binding protein [Bacilli bacterium]|jgi:ABC-2 type transport system ATP-binding protein
MIEIKGLSKSYGTLSVLENLNLKIETGSIFGLVGINGSGKSTLLRLMAGVYQGDTGVVLYDGEDVFDNPQVKKEIFFLPDDPFYTFNSKGADLVEYYKTFYQFDDQSFKELIDAFKLPLHKTINNFSKGMKRQLFIALAMATKPKYLLLDEAFDGLDPLARLALKRQLIALTVDHQSTIVISSHSLRELEDICDSYGIIDHREIINFGEVERLMEQIHKYQLAFKDPVEETLFAGLEILSLLIEGRIVKIVLRGGEKETLEQLKALKPLLIETMTLSFEEFFIHEVESRGYLK